LRSSVRTGFRQGFGGLPIFGATSATLAIYGSVHEVRRNVLNLLLLLLSREARLA
jgi:hypothetical protein